MPEELYPVAGKTFISEYPTPSQDDFYLWTWKDSKIPGYELPAVGTAHPDIDKWPNHKFTKAVPSRDGNKWEMWLWVADRTGEDDYNYTITYPFGCPDTPRYTRTYLIPRADYVPLALRTPDPTYPEAVLFESETVMHCDDPRLDSIYVKVVREFQVFPGPRIQTIEDDAETDTPVAIGQQAVLKPDLPLSQVIDTFTVPQATFIADTATDTLTATAHTFEDDMLVRLTTTTTLPAGLSPATDYWIINADTDTFQLAATLGGAAIDITTTGTGVHTATARNTFHMAGHDMPNLLAIKLSSTTTLPASLAAGTNYFTRNVTENTFQLAATSAGSIITVTTAGTGTHSALWGDGTKLSYHPKGCDWGFLISSSLLGWDAVTVTYTEHRDFPCPALLFGIDGGPTVYEARDGTGRVYVQWNKKSAGPRPAEVVTSMTYGPLGHANATPDSILDVQTVDLIWDGVLSSWSHHNVLHDGISWIETTGTENPRWPYIGLTSGAFPASVPSASAMDALSNAVVSSRSVLWKYGLMRKENTTVTFL